MPVDPKADGRRARLVLPVSTAKGGTLPAVDLSDTGAQLDIMERRRG